jgi:hypothetical protein
VSRHEPTGPVTTSRRGSFWVGTDDRVDGPHGSRLRGPTVATGEASLFVLVDQEPVAFLEQGGCDVEVVRLADYGVGGNAHEIMIERNNEDTLGVITRCVESRLPD